MKPILFLLLYLAIAGSSQAQLENKIDSLEKILAPYINSPARTITLSDTLVVNTMNELSLIYFMSGDCVNANRYSGMAFALSQQLNYRVGHAVAIIRQAHCDDLIGDFPKSLENYQQALLIFEELGDTMRAGLAMTTMATTYLDLGNYAEAEKQLEKAAVLFEQIGEYNHLASCYLNMSLMHALQKDYTKSIAYSLKALPIKEKLGDKHGQSIILGNLGASYSSLKDYEKGIEYFEKSLEMKIQIGDLNSIGASYCGLGGMYFNQLNFIKAVEYYTKGYEIAMQIRSIKYLKISRYGLFRAHYHNKNFNAAERFALELLEMNSKQVSLNFQVFSEKEKELYLKTIQKDFQKFNSFALHRIEQNPAIMETVYNTNLFYKGLLLKSSTAMRNAIISSADQGLIKNYEDWIVLKKEIAKRYSSGENSEELEYRADSIEKVLVKNSALFSDFENEQSITWKNVQSSLQTGEAAIELVHFVHDPDTVDVVVYCALIVKPGSQYPEMIELFYEEDLTQLIGNFQGNHLDYIEALYGKQNELNTALYDLIWKPMEPALAGTKKIFISPSGLLHRISFAALSNEPNSYLCDRYTLQLVTTTAKVAHAEKAVLADNLQATLFGGIDYSTEKSEREIWNYLEGTAQETEAIAAWLKKKNMAVEYFTKSMATESRFKELAPGCDILHIATHGFFYPDPKELVQKTVVPAHEQGDIKFRANGFGYASFVENDNPLMRSGLVLAGANDVWSNQASRGEDGVLTAQEVAHIDMRGTELVVLSACETGLGDIVGSEGVYGLQRSFKMAGVKYIIMSLWQVPDKETAEFMQLFYKNLVRMKDIPFAFQSTRKTMREKYDPYYWAAFVLVE